MVCYVPSPSHSISGFRWRLTWVSLSQLHIWWMKSAQTICNSINLEILRLLFPQFIVHIRQWCVIATIKPLIKLHFMFAWYVSTYFYYQIRHNRIHCHCYKCKELFVTPHTQLMYGNYDTKMLKFALQTNLDDTYCKGYFYYICEEMVLNDSLIFLIYSFKLV